MKSPYGALPGWRQTPLIHFTSSEQTLEAASAGFLHHFEHFLHLAELFNQPVHILDLKPAAMGDTSAAAGIQHIRITALGGRHRIDDRFCALRRAVHLFRGDIAGSPSHLAGEHICHLAHWTHLF